MNIDYTKEQTLKLLYISAKVHSNKNRYNFTTKTAWKCLNCLTDIFVSFKQWGSHAIFCENCSDHGQSPTIVQAQYMRVLKEKQLAIVNQDMEKTLSQLKSDENNY